MGIEEKVVNSLRFAAVNMVELAGDGHLGSAMGIAPTLYVLYSKHLNVVPNKDKHPLRDRFILSSGHSSAILYATLNAMGFDVKNSSLREFRNFRSETPGHPELNKTKGVDCSTGLLGQGVANAVGLAIAEKMLAERVNVGDDKLVDNYTYVVAGDGCLMEGVSYEALSLAGSLKLNKLIVIYDYNKTTIDSSIKGVFNINPKQYAQSLGFNVIEVKDGNNLTQINDAFKEAKKSEDKPVFIIVNTTIGYGMPTEGKNESHGGKLGQEGIKYFTEKLDFHSAPFDYDKDVVNYLKNSNKRFKTIEKDFDGRMKLFKKNHPDFYNIFTNFINQQDVDLLEILKELEQDKGINSTREFGGQILREIVGLDSRIIGGSADLRNSTCVKLGKHTIKDSFRNREILFGIREFAMSAISNGLALYGFKPFCSTFLAFSDYMRSSIRMGSLMNLPINYILTNDGVSAGSDGPTHHAIDHIMSLRAIPNLNVYRPCDFTEVKACYYSAYTNNLPSAMILSKMPTEGKIESDFDNALKGGYVIKTEVKPQLDLVILATGTEVGKALDLTETLEKQGYSVRVVSMPCLEIFDKQSKEYRESVIPKNVLKISMEAGVTNGWQKYVDNGLTIGIDEFTETGKCKDVYESVGFANKNLLRITLKALKNNKK